MKHTPSPVQNGYRIIAMIILLIIGINALAAGYGFMHDPTGNGIGIGRDYLRSNAIFHDYFVPGIVLFTVLGIGSIVVMLITWKKVQGFAFWILVQGTIYAIWIIVQLTMVTTFHLLHLVIFLAGVGLVACAFKLKAVQKLLVR